MATATTGAAAAESELAARGAALARARARLQDVRREGGGRSKLEELDAERAVADAEMADAEARHALSGAREASFQGQMGTYEGADAADVGELAQLLRRAAAIEARRVARWQAFERQNGGRQYPHETGFWPELHDTGAADVSRLERWLQWTRARRGLSG
jgi:hypothetical protein